MADMEPKTRQEHYLSAIAGQTSLPADFEPITREEHFLNAILESGGGGGGGGVTSVNGMTGAVVIPVATASANGLMSSTDKALLDAVAEDYQQALVALNGDTMK